MRSSCTPCPSILAIALFLFAAPSVGQPAANADVDGARKLRVIKKAGTAFGTRVQIMATAHTEIDGRLITAHFEDAFKEIARVENLVADEGPLSEIGKINAAAGGDAVIVDAEVFQLLTEAVRVAKLSEGAFDPTFAALDGVWRFSKDDPVPPALPPSADGDAQNRGVFSYAPGSPPTIPPPAMCDAYKSLVDYRDLVLDEKTRSVVLKRHGMRVGLGGLSKGYALDRAANILEAKGVRAFVIAAGGDLVVRGDKGGKPWMVGIQDPRGPGHFAAFESLPGSVMTTSDYEKSFMENGKRYHHILDPRTGAPAEGSRSVTVVAGDGLSADALATAVFVLGPVAGMRLIDRLEGRAEAVVVTSENKVLMSKGMQARLRYRPPTDAP